MRCSGCGASIKSGSAFCENCGTAVPQPQVQNHHHYHHYQQSQPQSQPQPQPQVHHDQKSRIVAWILAFFFGTIGVHNFYLGFNGRGICQLLLTLSFIGMFISVPWVCIELIVIFFYSKDGRGVPLKM